MTKAGTQILTLTGLRFDANLGNLDHEKGAPQPIQVDAELNLGTQPLLPSDDDIMHVLDYRKVRRIIIEECTAVHVNLLDQKLWNPNPDFLSYTLSKAALESATTLLAQALAPRLRVVGVAPGLTLTSHMLAQDKFDALHKLSPLGRSSTPEDVAHAVRFALENRAITGTTLLVDGGQHLMKFDRDFSVMG